MDTKTNPLKKTNHETTQIDTSPTEILDDLPAERDALDFEPYVATLAGIIKSDSLRTPLTIGIFGSWGSGKTLLMSMVRKRLPADFHDVWFDSWRYEREESLWRALLLQVLATLLAGVPKDESAESRKALTELSDLQTALYRTVDREEAGGVKIDLNKLAAGIGQGAAQIGLSFIPGGSVLADLVKGIRGKEGKAAAEKLVEAIHRERSKIRIEQVQFLEQFHDKFRELVGVHVVEKGRRLVVFVDDLDRCLPEKAVEVIEAIKLFLDVPGCVFVLGLDQNVIARGIEIRYRELGLSPETTGQKKGQYLIEGTRYMEKIIQLPFHIPPIEPDNVGPFVEGLIGEWPHEECPKVFAEGVGNNPRQVKRTINVFLLLWRLAKERQISQIKPIRLAKVVSIQHIYPQLYNVLKKTPRLLSDLEDYYRKESASRPEVRGLGEAEKIEAPPALVPYIHRTAVRRLLIMHPGDVQDSGFTGLLPDELRLYFTLTRRAEAPPMTKTDVPFAGFEPQTVRIRKGLFLMGSSDKDQYAEDNEKRQHTVELPEYSIGKYPLTNVEYQAFVRETSHGPPPHWDGENYSEEKGDHPVVNVS